MTTGAQISDRNRQWLQEAEPTANLAASIGEFTSERSVLNELTRSACRINGELRLLARIGSGPLESEFDGEMEEIGQDLVIMLPLIQMIYNARKHHWFNQSDVLNHGKVYARTWHELVLKTAEKFTNDARLVNARNACRLLHDSQYESDKIDIHLELEFDRAAYVLVASETERVRVTSPRYSAFREPQEWLRLRKLKGLSCSRGTWRALVKTHGAEIQRESNKSARISIDLANEWGLDLLEFREPMT